MRKLAYCLPVAALFMLAACNNELAEVQSPEAMGMDILTAGMPVTRTDLSAGESGVTVNWSKGDKLGVIFKDAGGKYTIVPYTLYKGEGTTNASFSGSKVPGATKICAYYPYNAADTYDDKQKTVLTSLGSKLPMGGNIAEDNQSQVAMKNAAGVIAIPLTLPEGDTYNVKLISKAPQGGKALAISGSATISFAEEGATLAMSGSTVTEQIVTVEGTGEAEYIYFPVADGQYTLGLTVAEKGGNDAEVTITVCADKKFETGKAYDPVKNNENITEPIERMSLEKVFTKGGTFKLAQDMAMEMEEMISVASDVEVNIDLNEKSLDLAFPMMKKPGLHVHGEVNLKNGNLNITEKDYSGHARIQVSENGKLTLDHVVATGNGNTFIIAQGPHVQLNVLNSTIESKIDKEFTSESKGGYYCLATNATVNGYGNLTYGDNATINLKESHFKAEETAFMNNVPAEVKIDKCSFLGNHQAALMRGGMYTVSNSTFSLNAVLTASHGENRHINKHMEKDEWSQGNMCAFAAITAGNYDNYKEVFYQYPTILSLEGCTVTVEGTNAKDFPAMHVCANSAEDNVTLTLGEGNVITNKAYEWPTEGACIEYGTTNIMVNNKAVDVSYKGMEQAASK